MMKNQKIFYIVIAIVFIIGVILWRLHLPAQTQAPLTPVAQTDQITIQQISPTRTPFEVIKGEYPQLSLKSMSRDEATKYYVERAGKDHNYEWKLEINFFGKVVDQDNKPVAGAKVHLEWNTMPDPIKAPAGTAYAETSSAENGLFSLTGKRGKILGVNVHKDGYYPIENGNGTLNFEYANPSSPYYYEPDPNNPVVFHLRKKGEGAKLFSKRLVVPFKTSSSQASVNLIQGLIKPDGVLTITSDTAQHLRGGQAFPWTISLSMSEGGLVETAEQFAFQAPENGYASTAVMDMTNTDRKVWRGDMTRSFYFYLPSTNIYGRITVIASSSLPLVLDYSYNPKLGSRMLEPAP